MYNRFNNIAVITDTASASLVKIFMTPLFTPAGHTANLDLTHVYNLDTAEASCHRTAQVSCQAVIKRGIDIAGGCALLIMLAPVMSGVALAIKLTSPGPVLYSQERLTQGGRRFTIWKFRSMRVDAEQTGEAQLATQGDARVTPIGRFLRKTRLDELPQLFNVIAGDMSLIGPRPERPEIAEELALSIPRFHQRLGTKAGLTGLAQVIQGYPDGVHGYRRKLGLDILYIRKWSLLLDLWIAIKTIGVVLSGSGAR
jgi:exopolysaccharide biosynthesis polyprenyl glycosylphosphotransferase